VFCFLGQVQQKWQFSMVFDREMNGLGTLGVGFLFVQEKKNLCCLEHLEQLQETLGTCANSSYNFEIW